MDKEEAKGLIAKYNAGNCTTAEKAIVESWYLQKDYERDAPPYEQIDVEFNRVLSAIDLQGGTSFIKSPFFKWMSAAAAVIGIAICVYLFTAPRYNTPRHPELVSGSQDIAPGGNRATLTSNGNTINLSEAKTGIVVNDDITYNDGTGIAPLSSRANAKDLSLEVFVPRGGTYSIILQDGTKVWLNADSKLEFLSNYRNKLQRIVKLVKGEAYLEVAKDAKRPFIVQTKAQTIEVLGTHFNVNTYGDEHPGTVTSLLEGSVKASNENGTRILKPGERGVSTIKGILLLIGNASDDAAWKNDKFQFNNTPLFIVMSQLARWYDVEVVYPNGIPDEKFSGDIDRSLNASEVLGMLAKMHVKFKIEGKKIIVNK